MILDNIFKKNFTYYKYMKYVDSVSSRRVKSVNLFTKYSNKKIEHLEVECVMFTNNWKKAVPLFLRAEI